MGRFEKVIANADGVDRRGSGYYSTPRDISRIIYGLLTGLNPNGKKVLDPCVGKEELIQDFLINGYEVDSFDLNRYSEAFQSNFNHSDFLKYSISQRMGPGSAGSRGSEHDYIVMNPPYNCHEAEYIKENKGLFRSAFGDVGVHNLYALFLSAVIDLAKDGALMGVITSDSFLTSQFHKSLRKKILGCCSIHYLLLCPTNLFLDQKADVRTCIIVLQKGRRYQGKIKTLNRAVDSEGFRSKVENGDFDVVDLDGLILGSGADAKEMTIGIPPDIRGLFGLKRLGDAFACVTGISTGNDRKYLSKSKTATHDIPFHKNPATRRFHSAPDCFLYSDWRSAERDNPNFIVRNKSRLFKSGITCSSMGVAFGACYLPEGSLFGVNPNIFCGEEEDVWWLLAYLNSSLVSYLIRGILIRSNMVTSGYVSRLPLGVFSQDLKNELSGLARGAYESRIEKADYPALIRRIDSIIYGEMGITEASIAQVKAFNGNILKLT